jgi:hypothetical protein
MKNPAKPPSKPAISSTRNVVKRRAPPFERQGRQRDAKPAKFIAYDFETTRIEKGTPRPLYLTAYGESPHAHLETRIRDMNHLRDVLTTRLLIPEYDGVKFVAWNANNFDAYFVAAALVTDPTYIMRPYLTRSNALRGMRVLLAEFMGDDGEYPKGAPSWEFLDGIAMLGLAGTTLEKFLTNFAPNHKKITGAINFETETFDYKNRLHCAYAMRDSEGLYHGMVAAQNILLQRFNQPLTVTMGGACIKIFQSFIPRDVSIYTPPDDLETVIRTHAMRGGFCYCVTRYQGPVWKYDINQAYASAMREAALPAGRASHTTRGLPDGAKCYVARVTATNPTNKIPFYYRSEINGRLKALFASTQIFDTWLTCIEIDQLRAENWSIKIAESWTFESTFDMREYVDKLETIRMNCEGGPSGPVGTMVKAVGNHSYGKTVEQLEPINYLLSAETPAGYSPYYGDGFDPLEHIYFKWVDDADIRPKAYHQPQLGAFITAYVRMVVRRAALLSPDTWLYADTDCVVFSSDVTAQLDIDSKRYGAWKIEESGTVFQIIAKKVYTNIETGKGSAKGLNVKKLTPQDFDDWYHGNPPLQEQTQRQNFMQVMRGADMFRTQKRSGTRVEKTQQP